MRQFAFIAMLFLAASPALAQDQGRFVRVQGLGTVEFEPDVGSFRLGAEGIGSTVALAMTDHNTVANRILQRMRQEGIADGDLKTLYVSVRPRYNDSYDVIGYTVSSSVSVSTPDIDSIGDLMSAGVDAGAVSVSGPSFGLKDDADVIDASLAAAVEDARRKAAVLTEAADVVLGLPVTIDSSRSQGHVPLGADSVSFSAGAPSSVPIEVGTHRITTQVTVVFAFE